MRKLLYIVMIFIGVSACTSRQESKPYDWDDDLHQRLLADFCLTESQVKDYIRKYIPDVTDEQMRQWEESKALECRVIDGEKRYFRNAGPNLFRIDSACCAVKMEKEGTSLSTSEQVNKEHLPEVMAAVKERKNSCRAAQTHAGHLHADGGQQCRTCRKNDSLLVALSPDRPAPPAKCKIAPCQRTPLHIVPAFMPAQHPLYGEASHPR